MKAGTLEIDFVTNLARLSDDMAGARRAVSGAAKGMEEALGAVKSALGALGVGLSAAYFKNLIGGAIDAMDHLNDLSKTTRISVEQLSGLAIAAKQSGGDIDSIAASINKLSVEMGKAPEKFSALGISAKDPLEAFKQLSDIFRQIEDPQTRAAVAAAALGKAWAGAAPLLDEGSKKIAEMVEAGTKASGITAEMARQADELNDKWVLLWGSGGALNAVVAAMTPALIRLTDQMIAAKNASSGFWETLAKFATTGGGNDIVGKWLGLVKENNQSQDMQRLGAGPPGGRAVSSRIPDLDTKAKDFLGLGGIDPDALAKAKKSRDEAEHAMAEMYSRQMIASAEARAAQEKDAQELADFIAKAAMTAEQRQKDAADAILQDAIARGQVEAEGLMSLTEIENLAYAERLANLNLYLQSSLAANAQAAGARQGLEVRHQQTLLQIERDKNREVRAMQMGTWSLAGQLLQQFAGQSKAAAIAVIAINKGLAIAMTIQNTAGAVMRAIFDLGPIAGSAAAAQIEALGAVQIGLIAASGLVEAGNVGGGGASLGSPANPINTTGGIGSGGAQGGAAGPAQTTIIQFHGGESDQKLLRRFVDMLNENTRDGGRILLT